MPPPVMLQTITSSIAPSPQLEFHLGWSHHDCPDHEDGKRPDGMSLVPWSSCRPLVWDAACPDTFATSYRGLATSGAGSVAASAEEKH